MGVVVNATASNPLTFFKLIETLGFQIGLLGTGLLLCALLVVPYLTKIESKAMLQPKGLKRAIHLFIPFTFKGVCFILLIGTLGILLTDVGWPQAIQRYGLPNALLFARASGAPNGAHLLSYIPLPLLGLYVAWKYRKDTLLDCFQGILVVAFGVAVHELVWLIAYWVHYAPYWNLAVATNIMEDVGFSIMCLMFVYAFWKYPLRSMSLEVFLWPVIAYGFFIFGWWWVGMPISTINNWQIGQGIYEITPLWADPLTNALEITSWIFVAVSFFMAIWHGSKTIPA